MHLWILTTRTVHGLLLSCAPDELELYLDYEIAYRTGIYQCFSLTQELTAVIQSCSDPELQSSRDAEFQRCRVPEMQSSRDAD
jgi:hypothetical protein